MVLAVVLILAYLRAAAPSEETGYYLTPMSVGLDPFFWTMLVLGLCKRSRFAKLPLVVSLLTLAIAVTSR